jgi:hypothetical protein
MACGRSDLVVCWFGDDMIETFFFPHLNNPLLGILNAKENKLYNRLPGSIHHLGILKFRKY